MTSRDLTEEEIADLRMAFEIFDVNGTGIPKVMLVRLCTCALEYTGSVDKSQLQQVMRKLGQDPTEVEVNEMIRTLLPRNYGLLEAGTWTATLKEIFHGTRSQGSSSFSLLRNHEGTVVRKIYEYLVRQRDDAIDFDEFLLLMKSRVGLSDPDACFCGWSALTVRDVVGTGPMDRQEVNRLVKKLLGEALTEQELDEVIEEVDTDGDGVITYEDFREALVCQECKGLLFAWRAD